MLLLWSWWVVRCRLLVASERWVRETVTRWNQSSTSSSRQTAACERKKVERAGGAKIGEVAADSQSRAEQSRGGSWELVRRGERQVAGGCRFAGLLRIGGRSDRHWLRTGRRYRGPLPKKWRPKKAGKEVGSCWAKGVGEKMLGVEAQRRRRARSRAGGLRREERET